ncbi:PD-(D/E)XK nuclease-like domain-containing protein [Bifidobacterium boum]|uniref:PD-(D/E)XK nuclease-like domain-containing protein n=2 Tax=Bacillati TaxID=1783272 RepID=UPI003F8E2DD4
MPTTITRPGIYDGIPDADYHADPIPDGSLSVSRAKALLEEGGPARFRHHELHGRPRTAALDLGSAVHALILGEGKRVVEVAAESWRTKAAREVRDAAHASGQVALLPAEMRLAEDLAGVVYRHPAAVETLAGEREQSMFAHIDGLWLRGRADVMNPGWTADYKTARDASERGFLAAAHRFRYYLQAAWYRRLRRELTGDLLPFRIVAQEKTAPYLVSVWEVDPSYLALGEGEMAQAITLYRQCVETGRWPGYSHDIRPLIPPTWAYDDDITEE